MKIRFLILPFLLFALCCSVMAEDIKKVQGEYTYLVPENMSQEEAKGIAIERARIKAIADAFGIQVSQSNTTVIGNVNGKSDVDFYSLSESDVKGEWVEDLEPPVAKITLLDGRIAIVAKVKGRAREVIRNISELDVRVLRNCTDPSTCQSVDFRNHDDMFVYFRSPQNGYLCIYLYCLVDGNVYSLLPGKDSNDKSYRVKRNEEYTFFSEAHRKKGDENLKYELYTDKEAEHNELYVIFSTNEFSRPVMKDASVLRTNRIRPSNLTFEEFNKWLNKSTRKDNDMEIRKMMLTIKK